MILSASNRVEFWDNNVWHYLVQIGIILLAIIVGNIIRRKVKFITNSLLPSSVIAGILIFILKFIPAVSNFIDSNLMEILTYHCLGLGFIALSLKSGVKTKDKNKLIIMDSGLITVNGYLVQAVVGLGITILLSVTIMKDLFPAAGLLLPMGYGQGTGQAMNIGLVYEKYGFTNGITFGLAIAAVGFIVACVVGVIYLNCLKSKNKLTVQLQRKAKSTLNNNIYEKDETPLNESVDKLTMQVAFVIIVYMVTLAVIGTGSFLAVKFLGNFGVNTVKPLLWGFNFLFGSLSLKGTQVLSKSNNIHLIPSLRKFKLMNHQYINSYMMDRMAGLFFDVMIVAGIAAINWNSLEGLMVPLILVCILGGFATFFYLKFVCKKIYPEYEYEAFFSFFGMLTGTASTGMILLREIDPNFETPAADNLVLQQLPAIIFGAPLLLIIGLAGKSLQNAMIILGVATGMLIIYNILLLRKSIFKKKKRK